MKTKYTLILGSFLLISLVTVAQDKKSEAAAGQPSEAETKAWMEYMTPGEVHKMLSLSDGEWHEELTFWMAPGGPPTKATSDCTNKMILGGRYQESLHTGNMMGMPFEGRGLLAYDNIRKVLQSTWVDNMGTGIMITEGKYDQKSKTATLSGKMMDPMTGKMENVREVIKFVDAKTQVMEMYVTKNGKEYKSMEITSTRK